MNASPLISICVPSFNRPETLDRMLHSVDTKYVDDVEIVVCEDCSPKRLQIRKAVELFMAQTEYNVRYVENDKNLGYDKNLRELIVQASGEYIIFMGDDDMFVPGGLDQYIDFLRQNRHLGYVLKTLYRIYPDGSKELAKYFSQTTFFEPSLATSLLLFRRSVCLPGFTFKREWGLPYLTDRFDGTLLFQIYLLVEICMRHPSAFFDVPLTQYEKDASIPFFGSSEAEKGLYKPGEITFENSINFMKGYFKITRYLDEKYATQATNYVCRDISKYSYPVLSIQRRRGLLPFLRYVSLLNREVGINTTVYYYIYVLGLCLLGEKACDKLIIWIKKALGSTPRL